MKIKEFTHPFKPPFRRDYSTCYIRTYEKDGKTFILFEDLGDGLSVTNAAEQLATELVEELKVKPEDCRFFETYREFDYESFDEITHTWNDNKASKPVWKPAEEFKSIFLKK